MKKLRIFIVEDEAIILRCFCMHIEKMGHEVVGKALNGVLAVEKINELNPDMVLVDINIPGKDGLTVIKEACLDKMIPTIVITGHISNELVERANCQCVFGYLMKPISEEQLTVAVNIAWARSEELMGANSLANEYKTALDDRKYIERAKGILMDEFGLKENEAMTRLQKLAKDRNKKLSVVAHDVIQAKKNLNL